MAHFKAKMHQIRFPASVRPYVRLCLRWSLTLSTPLIILFTHSRAHAHRHRIVPLCSASTGVDCQSSLEIRFVASLVVGLEGPAAGVAVGWLREQGASGGGGGSRPASIHCSFVPDTNGLLGVPVAARRRGDYKSIDATSGCVLCTARAQLQGSKLVSK